jgi:hypothetical protein
MSKFFTVLLNVLGLSDNFVMLKGRLLKTLIPEYRLPFEKYVNLPKVSEG